MRTEIRCSYWQVRTGANKRDFFACSHGNQLPSADAMKSATKPFYKRKFSKNPIKPTRAILTVDIVISNNFNQLGREGVWQVALWR